MQVTNTKESATEEARPRQRQIWGIIIAPMLSFLKAVTVGVLAVIISAGSWIGGHLSTMVTESLGRMMGVGVVFWQQCQQGWQRCQQTVVAVITRLKKFRLPTIMGPEPEVRPSLRGGLGIFRYHFKHRCQQGWQYCQQTVAAVATRLKRFKPQTIMADEPEARPSLRGVLGINRYRLRPTT